MPGLYSIFDTIKNMHSTPITCETDGQAWREFHAFIQRDEYARVNPQEFQLYEIAQYDQHNGIVTTDDSMPRQLIKHLDVEDLIKEKENV